MREENNADLRYLNRCVQLAQRSGGAVKNNPNVGALIFYNDRIIGEGWHKKYGGAHAEIEAINNVKLEDRHLISKSHLYVSLEPCNHVGKTPACTSAIIENKIPKVTIATLDPTDQMSGKSVALLRESGIEVNLAAPMFHFEKLIEPFRINQLEHRPHITLKYAVSKDNYIGRENESTWLTNQVTGIFTHQLRRATDAILVGTNTAIIDNPRLTTRNVQGPSPIRIVLDKNRRIPNTHYLLSDEHPTWIISTKDNNQSTDAKTLIKIGEDTWNLPYILKEVHKRGINRLIAEGGAQLLKSLIEGQLWEDCYMIRTPQELGSGIKAPVLRGKKIDNYRIIKDNLLYISRL